MKRNFSYFALSFFVTILFYSFVLIAEDTLPDSWTYGGITYKLPVPRDQVIYPPDLPKVYIVKEKDTLWDLSGAYLKNPFFWPLIWEVNPQVQNPHRIYPGDEIYFPGVHAKAEATPQETIIAETTSEDVKPVEVAKKEEEKKLEEEKSYSIYDLYQSYFASGFISDKKSGKDVIYDGKIISAPFEHGTITLNSKVFVDAPDCQKDAFYKIFRVGEKIKHPKTKKTLGRLVHTLGYMKIVCGGSEPSEGIITKAYDEIQVGDKIIPCDITEIKVPPEPKWADCFKYGDGLKGTIVSTENRFVIFSDLDLVYLDVGSSQGVKPGDYFAVVLKSGTKDIKIYNQIAQLVILKTKENTSSAAITKSIYELQVGDTIELL
jgi:hypothetical protein